MEFEHLNKNNVTRVKLSILKKNGKQLNVFENFVDLLRINCKKNNRGSQFGTQLNRTDALCIII